MGMETQAIIFEKPEALAVRAVELKAPAEDDLIIDVAWSGVSTGTERLLWTGRMPQFPGMGYPLVPGYEAVGRISRSARDCSLREGDFVFVPGASCFGEVRGLFGGSARRLVVPARRAVAIDDSLQERGVLLALAATAYHAVAGYTLPDLIVGHGVLGRLLARITIALGGDAPVVWETNSDRVAGAMGYSVTNSEDDTNRSYRAIYDVSGSHDLLDSLISRLSPGGEVVLAGFYDVSLSFEFVPAFLREARMRVAAEWKDPDLRAVKGLIESGDLSLDGLITHRKTPDVAADAYHTAFTDPTCLKMILDWSTPQ